MLLRDFEKIYPSAKTLVKEQVASRVHAQDTTLFPACDASAASTDAANGNNFLGWTDLCSNPPYPIEEIQAFAEEIIASNYNTILLVGEGGSTQAAMAITKYNKPESKRMRFRTLDSVSPVRVRSILAECNLARTLIVISSKSGSTIEPSALLACLRTEMAESMSDEQIAEHLVAITDPGSPLEKLATEQGWRRIFSGEPRVGGRFSAMSVFGLVPAALTGIKLREFVKRGAEAERACSEDAVDNPAVSLAAFLYDNYCEGRDKFSFFTPKRGRVLGLWIEQLVAESLGKDGKGILPNIEIDPLTLNEDPQDRTAIMYYTKTDFWDERRNFEMSLAYMAPSIPRLNFQVDSVYDLAEEFVIWEYAIAMCGWLMELCPFDQPDVASAKAATLEVLREGHSEPDFVQTKLGDISIGDIEVRLGETLKGATSIEEALEALMASIEPGDYVSINAFLPFTGEGRREAMERIRHNFAFEFDAPSCLEVGPRYLHSTGQLHKGGPNKGVFLILSSDEFKDIPIEHELVPSLASLAKAQAEGDLRILSERGRRVMHLHLPDNAGITLSQLSDVINRCSQKIARVTDEG